MRVYSDQESRTLKARTAQAVYEHLKKKKTDQIVAYREDMCVSCDSQDKVYPEHSEVLAKCKTCETPLAMGQDTLLKRRIQAIGHIKLMTDKKGTNLKVCGYG